MSGRRLGRLARAVKWVRFGFHFLTGLGVLLCLPMAGTRAPRLAAWWYRRLLAILGVVVSVEGDLPASACLVVANHVSWLDIIVLGSALDVAFLSKAEVAGWPLVGAFARYTGTVFLPRGAGVTAQAVQRMAAALRAGRGVVLFPESTTGRGLLPAHFHARLFAAAVETGVAVQPVAVHYLRKNGRRRQHPLAPWVGEQSILAHFLRLFSSRGLRVQLRFCSPLTEPANHGRTALAAASHAAISAALDSESATPAAFQRGLARL